MPIQKIQISVETLHKIASVFPEIASKTVDLITGNEVNAILMLENSSLEIF
jgi:hypothetical protein